jgi:hypothetical protein
VGNFALLDESHASQKESAVHYPIFPGISAVAKAKARLPLRESRVSCNALSQINRNVQTFERVAQVSL